MTASALAIEESLDRAKNGSSVANFATIYAGFIAKGIPASEIVPRENVFNYNVWQRLGRQVRKGEHGVRICTFVLMKRKDAVTGERKVVGRRPKAATVFHISQTDPIPGMPPYQPNMDRYKSDDFDDCDGDEE